MYAAFLFPPLLPVCVLCSLEHSKLTNDTLVNIQNIRPLSTLQRPLIILGLANRKQGFQIIIYSDISIDPDHVEHEVSPAPP